MKPKFLNLVIPWQVLLILLEMIAVTIFALGQPVSHYVFLNWIAIVAACSAVLIILIWLPQKLPGHWLKLLRRLLHDLSADTGQLLIIHLVVVAGLVAFYVYEPMSRTQDGAWASWLSVVTAVLALAIWLSSLYERWKVHLPKQLSVIYVLRGSSINASETTLETAYIVGGYFGAALAHSGDIRALAQQIGQSVFSVNYLPLEAAQTEIHEHASPVVSVDGRVVIRYAAIIPVLQDPRKDPAKLAKMPHLLEVKALPRPPDINKFYVKDAFWQELHNARKTLLNIGCPAEFIDVFQPYAIEIRPQPLVDKNNINNAPTDSASA
jgi:hypothetical protein